MDQTIENTVGRAAAVENPPPRRKADWPRA
jgi:hypothetical protein